MIQSLNKNIELVVPEGDKVHHDSCSFGDGISAYHWAAGQTT